MRKTLLAAMAATALLGAHSAGAHCQVPCGIYDDTMRIEMLLEDVQTIEKAIAALQGLAGKTAAADLNQLVRWIENKDLHADRIGEIASEYFLRQRIKAPSDADLPAQARYVEQLKVLHGLLVTSMRAKQTVDPAIPGQLRELVERLKRAYFSEEEPTHAQGHSH